MNCSPEVTAHRDMWKEHQKSLHGFSFYCTLLSTLFPKAALFTANGFLYEHVPEVSSSSLPGSLCFLSRFWHLSVQNCALWGCCATWNKLHCIRLWKASIDQNNIVTRIWEHFFPSPQLPFSIFCSFISRRIPRADLQLSFFSAKEIIK